MANFDANGVQSRISQGTYGNLSVAESVINITTAGAKANDVVRFFSLPEGIRLHGLKLFADHHALPTGKIMIGDHQLVASLTDCKGDCPIEPFTVGEGGADLTVVLGGTLPTVEANHTCSVIAVIEYVALGSL